MGQTILESRLQLQHICVQQMDMSEFSQRVAFPFFLTLGVLSLSASVLVCYYAQTQHEDTTWYLICGISVLFGVLSTGIGVISRLFPQSISDLLNADVTLPRST